jgi:hypothetical protein
LNLSTEDKGRNNAKKEAVEKKNYSSIHTAASVGAIATHKQPEG